ncbi:MAG: hypothetical protein ACTSRZ_04890 [Promethearchaeota archaeon]
MPIYEILITRDLFRNKKEFALSLLKLIDEDLSFKNKIELGLFESLIQAKKTSFELIKGSNIRLTPDLVIKLNDTILCPVEVEWALTKLDQLEQLNIYFKVASILNTNLILNTNPELVSYLQYFCTFSIFIECSQKIEKLFKWHDAEFRPIILVNLKKNWHIIPKSCYIYKMFEFIEKNKNKDEHQLTILIKKEIEHIKLKIDKYFCLSLLYYYGSDEMKSSIKNSNLDSIRTDEKSVAEALEEEWVGYIKPEYIPSLRPKQIKFLTPEQLKQLTPEQLKQLTPEQLKQLTPEQLKQLTPEQLKQLTPEQLNMVPIKNLAMAIKKMPKEKKEILKKILEE